jgi:glutathionyl-hydroquinone reductase
MTVKHESAILEMFEQMYEDWYDDDDKKLFIQSLLTETGETMQSISDKIERGVKNGYSSELQIAIAMSLNIHTS